MSTGAVINTVADITSTEGMIIYKHPNLLSRINLTKGCVKYLPYRIVYGK